MSTIRVLGICTTLWLSLLVNALARGGESDVFCLRSIKDSLQDPNKLLSSWDFTHGFICEFSGIECWDDTEDRVLNIRLPNMGLKGTFPPGILNCSSIQSLDLSSNDLSGEIPSGVFDEIPFLTSLDLSYNSFSGEVPLSLTSCPYLNAVNLSHNRFSGRVPLQFAWLARMKTFDVSDNLLDGPFPLFSSPLTSVDFGNNPGFPRKPGFRLPSSSLFGFSAFFVISFYLGLRSNIVSGRYIARVFFRLSKSGQKTRLRK